MGVISFDFDDTLTVKRPNSRDLPNYGMIRLLRKYHAAGHMVVITTYRCKDNEHRDWVAANEPYRTIIEEFRAEHGLTWPVVDQVRFTNHQDKGPILALLGADIHYDDMQNAIDSAEQFGVRGILVTPGEDREWAMEEIG